MSITAVGGSVSFLLESLSLKPDDNKDSEKTGSSFVRSNRESGILG